MKKLFKFSFIIVVILFVYLFFKKPKYQNPISLVANDSKYNLEIADTIFEKSKGLSGRDFLCPNCGMIFIYHQEGIYPFWMKDTKIPLDIIWLDKNGRVVDIKTGKPHDLTPLSNQTPAQYIIELNTNSGFKIGDFVDITQVQMGLKPVSAN